MSSFTFDAGDLPRLAADLGSSSTRITTLASQVVRKAALDVEAKAKAAVPVDTGATRNSIGVDVTGDGGLQAAVGPTTSYAPYLENGTRRMRARPFMAPALDAVTPAFVTAMEQLGGQILG